MIRVFKPVRVLSRWQLVVLLSLMGSYLACSSDDDGGSDDAGGRGSAGKGGNASSGGSNPDAESPEAGSPATRSAGAGSGVGGVGGDDTGAADYFALGSVVIDAEGTRTTYLQTIKSLADGPFDNDEAIEMPGNGTFLASGDSVFAGLAEEPTWVRYTASSDGKLEETGRLSFLDFGIPGMDYGNAIVSRDLAVSVLSGPAVAVMWSPKTMEILRTVELPHLVVAGYSLEVWTTVAHDGLVYIPGRWADWDAGKIRSGVSTTILDPEKGEIVGVAEDDRCTSGGSIIFDKEGYGYVMGDGRNYSLQMYANAADKPAPENCLLRIAPGETQFEAGFFYTIPSLTGGLESITELETGVQGSGLGFARMFDPSKLPADVKPVDFGFWDYPAHKTWRIELANPPTAKPVDGLPYSAIGFEGSAFRGKLYTGESGDMGATSDIYETDPQTNHGELRFKMTGYFSGLYELNVE